MINDLAFVGRMVSIVIAIILYSSMWVWAIDRQKRCNGNAEWETILARVFISLNLISIGVWLVWSWIN